MKQRRRYFSRFHRSVLDRPASNIRPLKSCESRVTHLQRPIVILNLATRSNSEQRARRLLSRDQRVSLRMLALHALARRSNGSRDQLFSSPRASVESAAAADQEEDDDDINEVAIPSLVKASFGAFLVSSASHRRATSTR
ncbi:unnamed protein product [Trichogramma brassicae]|uniref:Uncharacterized protein n=1 Tax=Trichogramma brassicae TaxID=86971 RepID=A0A6H5IWG5_9HYME|nr:unnamed protein product [Trichogramma brassicae]